MLQFSVFSDEHYMEEAIKEAQKALENDEVPIGAVIVCNNYIIAKGHNMTEKLQDFTAHAEMIAITAASEYLGSKYLTDCKMYVTIEPCAMCAGAIGWSQLSELIFGAYDPKKGFTNFKPNIIHPKTQIKAGVKEEECGRLLKEFFQSKR